MLAELLRYPRLFRLLRLARRLGGAPLLLRLARLCYRLEMEGLENIPAQGPCLLVFNHVAHIADALVVLVLRQRRPDLQLLTWELAQPEICGLLQALGLDKDGGQLLPVELRPGGSLPALLQAREQLLQGGAVALAPEGQPTWDGRLQHPLQPGAAWLALQSGCPVVAVVSIGGYDIQPVWQTENIRLTGRMRIRSGQPFYLGEQALLSVPADRLAQGSQSIWQAMADLLPAAMVSPTAIPGHPPGV